MSNSRRTLLICCLAVFCSFFGITGCLVMLRGMQEDFGEAIPTMTWVPSTYTLVVAMFVVLAGALAERYGRRRIFLSGCFCISVGAGAVAVSSTIGVAIAGQAVSGLGAAAVMATSLSLVTTRFPDARERNTAISIWVASTGVGLASGPVACGFLVDHTTWRIPFGAVSISMLLIGLAAFAIHETDRFPRSIDLSGQVLSALTVALLVVGLLRGGAQGFSHVESLALLGGALVTAIALVIVERRVTQPIIDVRLFGNQAYSASLLAGFAGLFGFVGSIMLQSQFAQRGLAMTPTETGVRLLLQVVPFAIVSYLSARIVAAYGPRRTIVVGLTAAAAGAAGLGVLGPDRPAWQLAIMLGAVGAGSACAVAPSTSAALSSVDLEHLGQATIVVSAVRQIGAVLGTSLLGSIMLLSSFGRLRENLEAHGLPEQAVGSIVDAVRRGVSGGGPDTPEFSSVLADAFHDSFGSGGGLAYVVLAATLALIAAVGLLTLPKELSPILAPPPKVAPEPIPVGDAS